MVEEPKRTLAYLCPECRQPVLAEKTVFSLAAGPSSVPCPCGKSALKIDMLGDHVSLSAVRKGAFGLLLHPRLPS